MRQPEWRHPELVCLPSGLHYSHCASSLHVLGCKQKKWWAAVTPKAADAHDALLSSLLQAIPACQSEEVGAVITVLLEDPAHAAVALLAARLRDTAAAAVAPVGTYARQIPRPSPSAARGHACSSVPGGPRSAGPPWRPSAQTPPLTTSTAVRLLWPAGAPPQRQGCLQGKPHMQCLYTSKAVRISFLPSALT